MIDWLLTGCSLKSSHTSFGCRTHYWSLIEVSSSSQSLCHVSPGFVITSSVVEFLTEAWPKFFFMLCHIILQTLWLLNSQLKVYQTLMFYDCSRNHRSSVAKPLKQKSLKGWTLFFLELHLMSSIIMEVFITSTLQIILQS